MIAVLAGGGSTGHIAPMIATAEALRRRDENTQISCVGTRTGLEASVVPQAGLPLEFIDRVPLPRRLTPHLLTVPFRLMKTVRQAGRILDRAHADVVIGFGGYVSLPVYLAARHRRVPVVIHEANAVPGLANKVGARFAAQVCVTFANTGLPRQIVTGMPVRSMIAQLDRSAMREQARAHFGLAPDARVLLVSGGSQGAKSVNDAVKEALPALVEAGVSVLHITGKKNFEAHQTSAFPPDRYVRLPYVDRMDMAYSAGDLMLARSGSGTVTETAQVGLPAIFVPLPHGNGEQAKNAQSLIDAHAGVLIADADLTPARLVDEVTSLFWSDGTLQAMGAAARRIMPSDAADRVADAAMAAIKEVTHGAH